MAGDWIKVESVTPTKPEVYRIAELCGIEPEHAFGAVLCIWIWADQHTEDGNAPSVTKKLLERISGVTGIADAMLSVGWLVMDDDGATFPNFDRHNGKSAKKRALTAKRVSEHKQKTAGKSNAASVTSALPREEKRREEYKTPTTIPPNKSGGGLGGEDEEPSDYKNQGAQDSAKPPKSGETEPKAGEGTEGGKKSRKTPHRAKYKYNPEHHQIAVWMSNPVKRRFPNQTINLEQWADDVRKLMTIDGRSLDQLQAVWRYVTNDERPGFCWSANCRTPAKLREKKDGLPYFDIIQNQMTRNGGATNGQANQPRTTAGQVQGRESASERVRRKTAEWAERQGVGPGAGDSFGA